MDEFDFLSWGHRSCLALPQHVHRLDADQGSIRRPARLEAQHRACASPDEPVVLLHVVAEVLAHPVLHRWVESPRVDLLSDCDFGRRILVGVDHPGHVVVPGGQRLPQQPPRCALVTRLAEQEVDGVAAGVHDAVLQSRLKI